MTKKRWVGLLILMGVVAFIAIRVLTHHETPTLSTTFREPGTHGASEVPLNEPREMASSKESDRYVLPVADESVWAPTEYTVLKPAHPSVIMLQKGKTRLMANFSQVVVYQCKDGKDGLCIRFPNGQKIEVSESLAGIFPPNYLYPHTKAFGRLLTGSKKRDGRK